MRVRTPGARGGGHWTLGRSQSFTLPMGIMGPFEDPPQRERVMPFERSGFLRPAARDDVMTPGRNSTVVLFNRNIMPYGVLVRSTA